MELYKKLILAGITLIILTTISACGGINSLISGAFLVMGIIFLFTGLIKGKKDFFQTSEELKQLDDGMERNSKIRLVATTLGCNRDESVKYLEEYGWDEVRIFLEFKNSPERFYTGKKEIEIYNKKPETFPAIPNINPVTVSNCPSCGNMCPENLAYCPSCKVSLQDYGKATSSLPPGNVSPQGKKCFNCGHICQDYAEYCNSCEAYLSDETAKTTPLTVSEPVISHIKCPGCGNNCSFNLAYCTECGFKL